VVVDRGGPQDLITPGANGFIARSNDPADLADRVEILLRDAGLRARMGRAAREAAAERSWDAINGGLVESYEQVISRQSSVQLITDS
jgi:phosphatidylinositol alpha 1,6-mannosyltransferase